MVNVLNRIYSFCKINIFIKYVKNLFDPEPEDDFDELVRMAMQGNSKYTHVELERRLEIAHKKQVAFRETQVTILSIAEANGHKDLIEKIYKNVTGRRYGTSWDLLIVLTPAVDSLKNRRFVKRVNEFVKTTYRKWCKEKTGLSVLNLSIEFNYFVYNETYLSFIGRDDLVLIVILVDKTKVVKLYDGLDISWTHEFQK